MVMKIPEIASMVNTAKAGVMVHKVLCSPGMNVVIGSIGMGKSATVMRLSELAHFVNKKRRLCLYVPYPDRLEEASRLLPDYELYGHIDYRQYPEDAIINLPEMSTVYNPKNLPKGDKAEKLISDLATIRHRGQTIYCDAQELALIQPDFFRFGLTLFIKFVSPLSVYFERSEFQDLLRLANHEILTTALRDKIGVRELCYVVSDYHQCLIRLLLPSRWNEEISVLWGGIKNVD